MREQLYRSHRTGWEAEGELLWVLKDALGEWWALEEEVEGRLREEGR